MTGKLVRPNLRFRVRFDARAESQGAYGATTGAWAQQFTRWAEIRPLMGAAGASAGEQVMAQRLTGLQPVLIIVRYDSQTKTIDPAWRAVELKDGAPAQFYALKTAADMERDFKYITLLAVAGEADAA